MELHPHHTGDVALRALHVGSNVLMQGGEPQPIIDEVGIFQSHLLLESQLVLGEGHRLQGLMRHKQHCRCRRLIDLPRLYAHQPVFHVIDTTHAVLPGNLVQLLNQGDAIHLLAIEADRYPPLEANLHISGLIWGICWRLGPGKDLLRRLGPGVLQNATLDAPAPQVGINGIGASYGDGDRDAVLLGIGDLLLAGQAPFPSRGDDLEMRGKGSNADIEPHLVIPLPGAAMSHR